MTYTLILLIFGLIPLFAIWFARPGLIWRYKGSLLVIVILILLVSVPWEMASIGRIWYYAPGVIWGARVLNLPVEEIAFFIIDGLLVGSLAILLGEKIHEHP